MVLKTYLEKHFADVEREDMHIHTAEVRVQYSITEVEVKRVIKEGMNRKAPGLGDFSVELLKLIDLDGTRILSISFNQTHQTSQIPNYWMKSTKPKGCDKFQLISIFLLH